MVWLCSVEFYSRPTVRARRRSASTLSHTDRYHYLCTFVIQHSTLKNCVHYCTLTLHLVSLWWTVMVVCSLRSRVTVRRFLSRSRSICLRSITREVNLQCDLRVFVRRGDWCTWRRCVRQPLRCSSRITCPLSRDWSLQAQLISKAI